MSALLQARDLALSYGRTPALRGVSATVDGGEIVAVTGPSGSGKSSLLHCLAGVLRPDGGSVHFAGERIDTWSEADRSRLRRSAFGLLFQFGQLVAELSAVENVALPLLLAGTGRRAAEAAARTWLDRFGVGESGPARPGELSGGEQQRVALARALITEPRILFADEPTGALDTLAGEQVLGEILSLARETGMAVVLVTHDARIAGYADREIAIRDGLIDESGLGLGSARLMVTGGDR
jgi:putative ABC transport system ATP-binding protein